MSVATSDPETDTAHGVSVADELRQRIDSRTAVVAVVGLGYVGLPLAKAFHDARFPVLGVDSDGVKIDKLSRGEAYLKHLGEEMPRRLAASKRFTPTADPSRLAEADVVCLCVPTPLGSHREPDLSFVLASTRHVAEHARSGQMIVLVSTTYPGTTRGEMLPMLAGTGLEVGQEIFLAYSPEREDPGRHGVTTSSIPRLVGGVDAVSTRLAERLFSACVERVHAVASAEVAEAAKLLENIYRAVNIALVNELKVVLDALGIDVWQVIEAASTKPFGFQPFSPGPGLGGHCIPIDPFYLTWKAKEVGLRTRFIELAGEVNMGMPKYVVGRVVEALNDRAKALRGSRVLVVGIAYKPNVDDIRESPAAEIIERLLHGGADVAYHDPHIASFPAMRHHDLRLESVALEAEMVASQDCVLVVTDHRDVDWQLIADHAELVVDTRNVMRRYPGRAAVVTA